MHVTETLEAIQKLSIAEKRENVHHINSSDLMKIFVHLVFSAVASSTLVAC